MAALTGGDIKGVFVYFRNIESWNHPGCRENVPVISARHPAYGFDNDGDGPFRHSSLSIHGLGKIGYSLSLLDPSAKTVLPDARLRGVGPLSLYLGVSAITGPIASLLRYKHFGCAQGGASAQ
ncbi:hypothetical protein UCD39_04070 [Nitrospirillum sp. BR 11752]|uniref:hypothetical protein n=1 Tax=Nitrospirillum sp. BR 11752 TaxID=3104293 RepID=UPI002EBC199B|nr:hypothetical protein [Nitrospirillum sp. BR 11752]